MAVTMEVGRSYMPSILTELIINFRNMILVQLDCPCQSGISITRDQVAAFRAKRTEQ